MSGDTPVSVDNEYRWVLVAKLDAAWSALDRLRSGASGVALLLADAWKGGLSDQALDELSGIQQSLSWVADDVEDTFQGTIDKEPLKVPSDSWKAKFLHQRPRYEM